MNAGIERVITSSEPPVSGFLHRPQAPSGDGLVLTHGAGADCNTTLLMALAEAFALGGMLVLRCDLPFRQRRPHGPPPRGSSALDQQGLRQALAVLHQGGAHRLFLGGHSYGGRQASMLAAGNADLASGLLLLSYPLHPPQRLNELRTAHFPALQTPALFVSGAKDGFATPDELRAAVALIPARTRVLTIPSASHSLLSKANRDTLIRQVIEVFGEFFAVP